MAKISMILLWTFLTIVFFMCETRGAFVRRFNTKSYQPKQRAFEKKQHHFGIRALMAGQASMDIVILLL